MSDIVHFYVPAGTVPPNAVSAAAVDRNSSVLYVMVVQDSADPLPAGATIHAVYRQGSPFGRRQPAHQVYLNVGSDWGYFAPTSLHDVPGWSAWVRDVRDF
jgi:hypothetical protein